MARKFALFPSLVSVNAFAAASWDLLRTWRPNLTDPEAQTYVGGGQHAPKALSVATGIRLARKHPSQNVWAFMVDDSETVTDVVGLVQWFEDHSAVRAQLLSGPTITTTFPDGATAERTNHLWTGDAPSTAQRYLAMRRIVLPDAWNVATAYTPGDTCWRTLAGGAVVGFRCLIANTGSAPTMANANWDAYLGPLPASWTPVLT